MSVATKNPPKGWPRISSSLIYENAGKAIDFLTKAFGFEVLMRVDGEGGRVVHSELVLGGGLIMVSDERSDHPWRKSPRHFDGANTQTLCIYIDDAEAHCERARAAGAKIASEPKTTDYGDDYWTDRGYEAVDPEGHHWWFVQRLRDPKQ
jgi:uncharacterized glyoxalase superfamily protein PhnB